MPLGTVRFVQLEPPSPVVMTTAPGPSTKPAAKHTLTDGHEIVLREPVGTVWLVQIAPPFVVSMTTGVLPMTVGT
jgi:hypothetical protein